MAPSLRAGERVLTYFRDVDPAFIDARVSGDDPTAAIIADAIARVRAPVLVLAGEPRLGGALDDASEWRLKKLADVTIKRCMCLRSQPERWNSVASQSSNSG